MSLSRERLGPVEGHSTEGPGYWENPGDSLAVLWMEGAGLFEKPGGCLVWRANKKLYFESKDGRI